MNAKEYELLIDDRNHKNKKNYGVVIGENMVAYDCQKNDITIVVRNSSNEMGLAFGWLLGPVEDFTVDELKQHPVDDIITNSLLNYSNECNRDIPNFVGLVELLIDAEYRAAFPKKGNN
jgi:hypothetical protein